MMKIREGLSSFSVITKEKKKIAGKQGRKAIQEKEENDKITRQCKASSPSHVGDK